MKLPWPLGRRADGDGDGGGGDDGGGEAAARDRGVRHRSSSDDGDGVVESVHGIHETEQVKRVVSGEETTFGGEKHGMPVHTRERQRQMQLAMRKGDPRMTMADVDDMQHLLSRFHNEFARADAAMRRRKEEQQHGQQADEEHTTSWLSTPSQKPEKRDAKSNWAFEQWRDDQRALRERLQLHWLDMVIDRPLSTLIYFARGCTTLGLCYGVGRTVYLYRTMDKVYAKLNGVSLGSIAVHEISYYIVQSAIIAVAATVGLRAGDVLTSATATLLSDDVKVPQRTWHNIAVGGMGVGLCAGATFAAWQRKVLTRWGQMFVVSAMTIASTTVGLYIGRRVYLPATQSRTRDMYDAYWHPWYTRYMHEGGPIHVRGRYV